MFDNVTLIVSTCEKNKYLLNNFFKLLKINFPEYNGKIKVTIKSSYSYKGYDIENIHNNVKDDSFSSLLIQSLKEINTDYIIFMLEDFYLLERVNMDVIKSAISTINTDKDIGFIQLNDQSFINQFRYSSKEYNKYFLLKNNRCPYSVNAQFAVWRKDFLLKILRKRESAWDFEYIGTTRVNKIKHKSLTVNEKYKQGSKLYPDGGVLHRGKIIKEYGNLYKRFNLEEFYYEYNEISEKKHLKDILKIIHMNNIKRSRNNAYNKIFKEFQDFDMYLDEYKKRHSTIGILYIAIGKYIVFWKKFYKYAEKNLFKNYKKIYFLFTDSNIEVPNNVKLIHQENLGWPGNTLFRYEIFMKNKDILNLCNYLYFVNANILVKRKVGEEILPNEKQQLAVTIHPAFYKINRNKFTYEKNILSTAYISNDKGKYYFMGGFYGGYTDSFLSMCEELSKNIRKDLKNNIIAVWHDESHLNKYMIDKNPLILSPEYSFPEGMPWNINNLKKFKRTYKLLIQDKRKWGGHNYLRGLKDN